MDLASIQVQDLGRCRVPFCGMLGDCFDFSRSIASGGSIQRELLGKVSECFEQNPKVKLPLTLQRSVVTSDTTSLTCCATNLKVAGSIPAGVGIFH